MFYFKVDDSGDWKVRNEFVCFHDVVNYNHAHAMTPKKLQNQDVL